MWSSGLCICIALTTYRWLKSFSSTEYYIAVYLPGHFFHLLNVQHPDLICHSLFLTGMAAVFPSGTWSIWICFDFHVWVRGVPFICQTFIYLFVCLFPGSNDVINMLPHSPLQSLSGSLVLDWCSGRLYRVFLSQSCLLQLLWHTRPDWEKMAVLHCLLSCGRDPQFVEAKVQTPLTFTNWQIGNIKCIYVVVEQEQKLFCLLMINWGLWSPSGLECIFLLCPFLMDPKQSPYWVYVCSFDYFLFNIMNKCLATSVTF